MTILAAKPFPAADHGAESSPSFAPSSSRIERLEYHAAQMRQRSRRTVKENLNPVVTWGTEEVAGATGLSLRQLQWWDERGILCPMMIRKERRYTQAHVECAFIMQRMTDFGWQPVRASKFLPKLHGMLRRDLEGALIDLDKHAITGFNDEGRALSLMALGNWFAFISFAAVRRAVSRLPKGEVKFSALRQTSRPSPPPSESRVGA